MHDKPVRTIFAAVLLLAGAPVAAAPGAADSAPTVAAKEAPSEGTDLALKLSNPIASLISVPFQQNFDFGSGADGKGFKSQLNIQPVVPIRISEDWNMISRTIVPIIYQNSVTAPNVSQFGLGDTVQSLFFSPAKASKVIWGAGPVMLVPTATDTALGGGKWGGGPTAVALTQKGGLTLGMLANHIWSFAGSSTRQDVSATFVQPFVSFTTKKATTYGLNLETTYDWKHDVWIVPMNLSIAQLVKLGKQPAQVGMAGRYYLASPTGGPDWGLRFNFVLLFPA
jgi:hypothetical protein